jgi:uncharacterized protein (UPF0210 family)
MIEHEKLDKRTITMGISLLDCCSSDGIEARRKIYDKYIRNDRRIRRSGYRLFY